MKKIKFARFGGLSSVNQKGYDSSCDGFHSPPSKRGFYAFLWPHYEFFLLSGGLWTNYAWSIGTKFSYLKDAKGNIIGENHPDYEYFSNTGKYWSIPTKEWYLHQKKHPEYEDPEYDAKLEANRLDWETNYGDKPKWVLAKKPSPRIFEYRGNIWHHLTCHLGPSGVLKQKGGWTLSPFDEYVKALEKDMHIARRLQASYSSNKGLPMSTKNPYRGIGKDQLEVFIEKL
jgi:hypothetical protein